MTPEEASAKAAVKLVAKLGSASFARSIVITIEKLNDLGCIVSLQVWYNGGEEAMTLPDVTGEFTLKAGRYQSLTDEE